MLKNHYTKIINAKIDAVGLSVFRVFYALILFCEIFQLFKFRHIVYDKDPYNYIGEIDVAFLFYFWFCIVTFLFFGLFTRFATIVNYIFLIIIFSSASHFEYHVFYAYVGINFLIIFMPISRVFSFDSLIEKLKYTQIGKSYKIEKKILELNHLILVFVGLGLVYIDSVFHKLSSKMWMDGLGVWLPSSLPMVVWTDTSFLLNQEWLVKFLGYLVLIFETVFVFVFWFKKWRVPLLILGIFFHLGILITYPIPWFALTAIAVYILLIPTTFWDFISKKIKFKRHFYTFYYDAECPLCNKVVVVIKHFDIFNVIKCQTVQGNYLNDDALKNYDEEILLINIHGVTSNGSVYVGYFAYIQLFKSLFYTYPLGLIMSLPGISSLGQKIYRYVAGSRLNERCTVENCTIPTYNQPITETQDILIKGWNRLAISKNLWQVMFVFFLIAQSLMIWFSPFIQSVIPAKEKLNKVMSIPYNNSKWVLVKYFGITHHPVFMFKNHFENYKIIFKIESVSEKGTRKLVPILDEYGMACNSYANGAFWVNSTFRVNGPNFDLKQYEREIIPYLKFYETQNEKSKGFIFYIKRIEPQEKWEKDFFKKQINRPWLKAGNCIVKSNSYDFHWNEKMKEVLKKDEE